MTFFFIVLILVTLALYLYFSNLKTVETFVHKVKQKADQNDIDAIVAESREKNTPWSSYVIQPTDPNTYVALDQKTKTTVSKLQTSDVEGELILEINKHIVVIQHEKENPSAYGQFNKNLVDIAFSKSAERFTINIGHNRNVIIGHGQFPNTCKTYSNTLCQTLPLIFRENQDVLAVMTLRPSLRKTIDYSNMPIQLHVKKSDEKYIPLYLIISVLIRNYLTSKL